jgi:hypothetical protein
MAGIPAKGSEYRRQAASADAGGRNPALHGQGSICDEDSAAQHAFCEDSYKSASPRHGQENGRFRGREDAGSPIHTDPAERAQNLSVTRGAILPG